MVLGLFIIMLRNNFVKFLLLLIIVIHSFILTKLIFFPYPELFIYPYLTNHGLKPYSQILDQHFPGLMFLPINFNNLGMNTPEVARIWAIVVVIITHILLYFIGREILKSNKKALLVNVLFLIWQPFFEGWILWIDNFLPLILLPAFYALYKVEKNKKWFFWLGLFLGVGIVFKQILIPLSVFVLIYLIWKFRKPNDIFVYILGLILPVCFMLVYLWSIGVLSDFWYWTVTFNLTIYAQFGRGAGPTLAHLSRVLFVFGLPFLLIRKTRSKETQIILIFLIGSLLGLSTRFDFVHFQPALPFAILATVYGLGLLGKSGRLFIVLYGLVTIWWLVTFYKGFIGDKVLSFDPDTKNLAAKIRKYTKPQEKIFVYGAAPHLYQISDTLPAGNVFVFQFPWFYKVAEARILEGIKQDKPNIIISNTKATIEDQKITEFSKDIEQYISQNYKKIDSVGTTDILIRKS